MTLMHMLLERLMPHLILAPIALPLLTAGLMPVSYTHLTLPTTPYV